MGSANKHKIGVIGVGKMGECIIQGIQSSTNHQDYEISGLTNSSEKADLVAKKYGIQATDQTQEICRMADILILCVKPHHAEKVSTDLSKHLNKKHLLISICAGISNLSLAKWLGALIPIVRAMPNTPCLVREGITVFSPGPGSNESHLELAAKIFGNIGRTTVLDETLMDGVTGLSGCGPAYAYLVIEALSDAGVKVGIPRKISTMLVAQTLLGSAKMVLDRGCHPAELKDEVTTPAGCTTDGLMALEEGNTRIAFIKAVVAATERSKKLK